MEARTGTRLAAFASRVNNLLLLLGTHFRLEDLGIERGGGTTGARFTLCVPEGRLDVAARGGEERLARVLSDGDRSALAFAVFLLSLEAVPALDEHVLVIDDPVTSLDQHRIEATAEQISKLGGRAKQVIVLSHHPAFLHQLSCDLRRHATRSSEIVELELDRGTKQLCAWSSEDDLRCEHVRRINEIQCFVTSSVMDQRARHIQGELRMLLEGHFRHTYPHLFDTMATLEKIVGTLRSDPSARSCTGFEDGDLEELDRICRFGARGNHDGSALRLEDPTPEAARVMAMRALALIRGCGLDSDMHVQPRRVENQPKEAAS
jgi:wobble nucleotide-excising tRNase